MSGFSNSPRILRGAFVEYGLSLPLLFVAFQFNPETITRNRSLTYAPPSDNGDNGAKNLRDFHRRYFNLSKLRAEQSVTVAEETLSFEIRLDATDKEDDGILSQFGIAPELSTLELMAYPKREILKDFLDDLGYRFAPAANPPLVLFSWCRKRVLPVNINSLSIKETLYSPDLNPIRAEVSVNLTVIEGRNPPYLYSKTCQAAMSALNLANVVIPG
jgi:hypothetical protein